MTFPRCIKTDMGAVPEDVSLTLLQVAVDYVQRSSTKLDEEKKTIAVRHAKLFGQLLPVIETFVRAPNEDASVTALSDSLKSLLYLGSVETCVNVLKDLKCKIHSDSPPNCRHFPSLALMKWRVDITISSSVLSRVLEPNIVIELELNDHRKIFFELSVAKFHKLRFTVASILKEMDYMNSKMSAIKV